MKDNLNNIPATMADFKQLLDSITKGVTIRDELFTMCENEITILKECINTLERRIEEIENKNV